MTRPVGRFTELSDVGSQENFSANKLYRALRNPNDSSARACAEERLLFVLTTNLDLAPEGWCDSIAAIANAIQFRARPDVRLRPKIVEAFAWCRTFLILGCVRLPSGHWNSTSAERMAFLAERAGEIANDQTLPIEQGVIIAAALSLGIEVSRDEERPSTRIAAYAIGMSRQ